MTEVLHDPVGQKFYMPLEDDEAVLAYTEINDMLDVHTLLVPAGMEELEQQLIKAAFDYVHKNRMKIIPSDPKIEAFAKENGYEGLITKI